MLIPFGYFRIDQNLRYFKARQGNIYKGLFQELIENPNLGFSKIWLKGGVILFWSPKNENQAIERIRHKANLYNLIFCLLIFSFFLTFLL